MHELVLFALGRCQSQRVVFRPFHQVHSQTLSLLLVLLMLSQVFALPLLLLHPILHQVLVQVKLC